MGTKVSSESGVKDIHHKLQSTYEQPAEAAKKKLNLIK